MTDHLLSLLAQATREKAVLRAKLLEADTKLKELQGQVQRVTDLAADLEAHGNDSEAAAITGALKSGVWAEGGVLAQRSPRQVTSRMSPAGVDVLGNQIKWMAREMAMSKTWEEFKRNMTVEWGWADMGDKIGMGLAMSMNPPLMLTVAPSGAYMELTICYYQAF